MRTILQAENLEKVYRIGKVDVHALRGVSLDVEEGEFLAIMGPSGCGKSTMLHLLGGLLTPTSGRIIIDDEDLTAASDAKRTDIRRRKIGFVFQRFNLFPTLTADGNLKLAESIHGGSDGKKGGGPPRAPGGGAPPPPTKKKNPPQPPPTWGGGSGGAPPAPPPPHPPPPL